MASIEGAPSFTSDEALEHAVLLFGLSRHYRVSPLPSYDDQNWRLQSLDAANPSFVFKIANAGTNQEELDLQNQAMLHLSARVDPTLGVFPTPKLSLDGRYIETVHDQRGRAFLVRLLHFIDGRTMGSIEHHSRAMLDSLGRLLAATDVAFARFDHAEASRRELQHWDLKYATPTAAFTHHVRDAEQRAMVESIFRKFELEVLPSMTSFRSSVIHGDANDLNVLVPPRTDADGAPLDIEPPQRVIGLIDFGDVVHSYTVFNVAIALAYVVQRKSDPMTAACHVLTAYHKLFPLTEREIEGILSS